MLGHIDVRSLDAAAWVAFGIGMAMLVVAVWRAVQLTLRPGEEQPDHIKRIVLRDPRPVEAQWAAPRESGEGR